MHHLITTSQACGILGVHQSTLSRLVSAGRLKAAMRVGTGTRAPMLFNADDVAELAHARKLAEKHGGCPNHTYPTFHNGDPCPEREIRKASQRAV